MKQNSFYRFGHVVYRFRWQIILAWVAVILLCAPLLPHIMKPFVSTGFIADKAESTKAQEFIEESLGYDQDSRFVVLYHSPKMKITNPRFSRKIRQSLSGLKDFPISHDIIYPKNNAHIQISKDKHSAYVILLFDTTELMDSEELNELKNSVKKPKHMKMVMGGNQLFTAGINEETQKDLFRADAVAAPLTGIVLLLVFGTIVAMLLPICLGGGCAVIILATLYFLADMFSLSIFTINLALLLGLCLTLDYALFIIFRFRVELREHRIHTAIAKTISTAGRAVFFSGFAVFISLSALLIFPVNILFSIGIGGLVAVFMAVMFALTLLPALLSVLNRRINVLAIRRINRDDTRHHAWRTLAKTVVCYRWTFFAMSLAVLLFLAYPFTQVTFGISDFKIVPKHTPSRAFFDAFKQDFTQKDLAPILVLVKTEQKSILSKWNISRLYRFTKKLKHDPHVRRVESIVDTMPKLSLKQYQMIYKMPASQRDPNLKRLMKTTTGKQFTVVRVYSKYGSNTPETRELVKKIRQMDAGKSMSVQVTGIPAKNLDVIQAIKTYIPYAMIWVFSLSYLCLLMLLRSVILPLKAMFMTMLSLCACYGVLVFVFQEGHFHQLLQFDPQGMLDITMVVIIFCALFGFSMDYEVFLLTRIQEHYLKTKRNDESIVSGIEFSNRIITSAALIVIIICASFLTANVLMVKAFGLGIAVAIAVDAFIIRSILVPSTMALLKGLNWYIPQWLDRLLPRL